MTFSRNNLMRLAVSALLCACASEGTGGGTSDDTATAELDISTEILTADAPKGGIVEATGPEDDASDATTDAPSLPEGFVWPDGISWPDSIDDSSGDKMARDG